MKKRITTHNHWFNFLFSAIILGFLFAGCDRKDKEAGAPGKMNSENNASSYQDWPIFRRDAELHGESAEDLATPLELAWSFDTPVEEGRRPLPFDATPVISEGVVYIGNQAGQFFALDLETGEKIWEFSAESGISGPAAVYGARVFFGDTGGVFYALNIEEGQEAWRFEADDKIEGGVNMLEMDGIVRVFFGSGDYHLYCLNGSSGELLWKHETDNMIIATPSLITSAGKQSVAFGGCDGIFHIVAADYEGEPKEIEVGSYIANSSCVRDGIAYVAHNGGEVLALDITSGEVAWKVDTGFEYRGSAAVGEKLLFVPSPEKKLTAYDRVSGAVVWEFQGRKAFDSSPVITESAIWQAGIDGHLYAVDPKTGQEIWQWEIGERLKASPAISRGHLVLASQSGVVYAFKESAK